MHISKYLFFLLGPIGFLIFLLTLTPSHKEENIRAYQGSIDLRGIHDASSGPVDLSGEWEFFWSQEAGKVLETFRSKITVPGAWNRETEIHSSYEKLGYGTYRLRILIPDVWVGKVLTIGLGSILTSYRLYIDGNILGESGTPSPSSKETIPRVQPKFFSFIPPSNVVSLEIFVSNNYSRQGGIISPVRIGPSEVMQGYRTRTIFSDIFAFASLLIMGLYHISLYLYLRSSTAPLYFGFMSLVISIRTLVTNAKLLMEFFPSLPQPAIQMLDQIPLIVSVPFYLMFFWTTFEPYVSKTFVRVSIAVSAIFTVATFFGSLAFNSEKIMYFHIFMGFTILYVLYVIYTIDFDKESNSAYILYGTGLLFLGIGIDLFYTYVLKVSSYEVSHFALVFFVFLQSLVIASDRSSKYKEAKILTEDLQTMNLELFEMKEKLVQKVEDRTKTLNDTLQQINRELEIAQNVQRKILTPPDREISGIRFEYVYKPLEKVGGDFLDISEVKPGKVRVLLADAVGHGVQASLMTMALKTEYEELKKLDCPTQVLKELNGRFLRKFDTLESIFPCFVADIFLEKSELLYASAGHPDQVLIKPDGTYELLHKTGPILGLFDDLEIQFNTFAFPVGSRLLLFSDGLIENRRKENRWSTVDSIAIKATSMASSNLQELLEELVAMEERSRGDEQRYDDITIIAIESTQDRVAQSAPLIETSR
ncbi:SpoIIE-like protein phosphatase domain protein [Leptospira broomii serovar Hurstbridge str. 5399]|uniref:SpoIIE-like protein phosphatase domain protein n=1 Tax=Leptospira broomii serovar Hurstbridge str. 5399 TaxID=1049789 RepID=T0GGW3_9LEPT|nr:SpoIIE family protein phosphatase [Leptospira broomii]EQA44638.1 SpoIIE-like protein phosphatase domain protein [Leptospira broomii serovar Hurstbridge str. 5399]